jgi:ABC-2 type transport system permease protein
MEVMNMLVKPSEFVLGKLLAHVGVLLVQLLTMAGFVIIMLSFFDAEIFTYLFEFTKYVNIWMIIPLIFYISCGFLIMAHIIMGVGAALPTAQESQKFMGYFIILSILPIYFMAVLLNEPSGLIAMVLSYFPLTSGMVLLFRNISGQLSVLETIFSSIVLIGYVVISFIISYKLFKIGSTEYQKKVSLREVFSRGR